MTEGLVSLEENEWKHMRYLCEGICPRCHGVMTRIGVTVVTCDPCAVRWESTRIPEIFPKDSIVKPKENQT